MRDDAVSVFHGKIISYWSEPTCGMVFRQCFPFSHYGWKLFVQIIIIVLLSFMFQWYECMFFCCKLFDDSIYYYWMDRQKLDMFHIFEIKWDCVLDYGVDRLRCIDKTDMHYSKSSFAYKLQSQCKHLYFQAYDFR